MEKLSIILFLVSFIIPKSLLSQKPNIIWIMAEDIGPDIECYGMPAVKTPNLNKLAAEGIKFTNAYCTNSICSPSRSAMMTGVHQNKINAQHHRSNRNIPLDKEVQPFTFHLRNAGYTCILGHHGVMGKGRKTDVNFKSTPIGDWDGKTKFGLFDKYDRFTAADQPFFAQIQLVVTHRGDWWDKVRLQSAKPVNPRDVVLPPFMADHPTIRLDWAKYLDQIEYADNEVGMIINDLKEMGIYENTIIIFIGDNGRCNIRGKGYLYDPGLHIPLIVHWPKGIKGGQIRDELVSTTDITATILDWAGAQMPDYLTGKSFIKEDFKRDLVYSSRDLWDEIMEKSRSIITNNYKYIRNDMPQVPWDAHQAYLEFYRPAVHVMRKLNAEGQLNKAEASFFASSKPKEELYDIEKDPYELNNLAETPDYAEILKAMREKCLKMDELMTAKDTTFKPITPNSVKVLEFVKSHYPEAYEEMRNGKEIGLNKFQRLLKNESKQ
jgi:N-sulfoglucosamine sulfohydrolase